MPVNKYGGLSTDTTLGGSSPSDEVISSQKAVASAISVKADDSTVVHKTGTETITGFKTLSAGAKITTTQSGAILELESAASGTNFLLKRTNGATCVVESGNFIGLLGTYSNHPFQIRTNYVNRMEFGTNGSVTLATAPNENSNDNQVATTAWTNSKIPTVNNATLTITQGGTTKGTFTANASNDVTIALDAGGGGGLPSQTGNAGKFLTTDGTDASWGKVKTNNLFDNKWCDYELNDQNWLRADTFSWQDGTVYSEAYSHLVADYTGGTAKTETVGSYTISYVEATDGHKITTDGTTVANIYNETGIAWYYVLDTTNQKFKLPRTKWGFVGVRDSVGKYVEESLPALPLHTTETEASGYGLAGSSYFVNRVLVDNAYSPSNYVGNSTTYQNNAKVQQQSTQMYLYFYVGQFSQSATEQTAGITTEQLNAKLDLDLGNATNTSKEEIVNLGMPDYTAGVSKTVGTNYTADKNGFIKIDIVNSSWGSLVIDGVSIIGTLTNNANLCALSFIYPIAKGQVYNASGVSSITFYPAKGG